MTEVNVKGDGWWKGNKARKVMKYDKVAEVDQEILLLIPAFRLAPG